MQSGIKERWLLLSITLLGSSIIIGSELSRLPASPQPGEFMTVPLTGHWLEPLKIRPKHDASRLITQVTPVLDAL